MSNQSKPPKFPYDDETMRYDYAMHMYVLTKNGVLNELGEDLDVVLNATGDANPSTLADRILRKVSREVYGWIYKHTYSTSYIELFLATYPPLRERVKTMLQAQLLYVLRNGFIAEYSGVNIAKGQIMDVNKLRGRARIAPEVEDLMYEDMPGLGICLGYRGVLPAISCSPLYRRGY